MAVLIGRSLIRSIPPLTSSIPSRPIGWESICTVCSRSSNRESGSAPATHAMSSAIEQAITIALLAKILRIPSESYLLRRVTSMRDPPKTSGIRS
jgi:hypothetical protein